ncbi:MAG TPA: tRNA pseudouridine(55) synthase TruB [Candidatus Limnocylindrales bacterium]|nr:tRNA pseudouridine(55) synthase TruB [Candidatus Limnocylindrales bacterium]
MSKRSRNVAGPNGLLLVDKPAGISSAAVVARVRRVFDGVKAGHTGTLDPFATGLLPLGLGEGTKLAAYLTDADKTYEGVIRLGLRTDTFDRTGMVIGTDPVPPIDDALLSGLAQQLREAKLQTPPAFSAIKLGGRPMYELARRGEAPVLEPRPVRVDRCELRRESANRVSVVIDCSKGFYVRSLARDLGEMLGCGAILESLRRTRVAHLRIEEAVPLAELEQAGGSVRGAGAVISMSDALPHMRAVEVGRAGAEELRLGRQGPLLRIAPGQDGEKLRILAGSELVAVAASQGPLWILERVFARAPEGGAPCPHETSMLPPAVSQTEEEEKERSESS